jgi:capsular polysaccharide export protein
MKLLHLSPTMARVQGLHALLEDPAQPWAWPRITFAGWGLKASARIGAALARGLGLPFVCLEDGFLRSFGPGMAWQPLSLVVDTTGIFFDSTRPSALENRLNSDVDLLTGREQDVRRAMELIQRHGLSKYNHAPPIPVELLREGDSRRVLVVDQTYGDMSVVRGGADANTFARMVQAARDENPGATLYIKTHPETAAGRKGGYLTALQPDDRTVLLRGLVHPPGLVARMDRVYVVSSTMGFEALLAGKPVTCFGLPWYAGWKVTDDRQRCARRTRARGVPELFAAAYLDYARYLNPATGQCGTIFDVIEWLVEQRHAAFGAQAVS